MVGPCVMSSPRTRLVGMYFSLIGRQDVVLPEGWTSQSSFTVLGRATIDATATPSEGATIRTYSLVGDTTVRVAAGARVRLVGGNLVGRREMDASVGEGPEVTVLACSLVGGIRVVHTA
jgi:hypothetical protein